MNFDEAISRLGALSARGMQFGLKRTEELLAAVGSPDKKLKIIHISGSNGKGSVAEYITRILIAAGKRAGTFTSPAVYDYLGQFRINGEDVGKDLFSRAAERVLSHAENATAFEAETVIALLAFVYADCEYAVVECGLGGAYDATNAISEKEIALISTVSLEHTRILGEDISGICKHKAGIIRDCPAVVSAYQCGEALAFFESSGVLITDKPQPLKGGAFLYKGKRFETKMRGFVQPYNAAVAIECARLLGIGENAIYSGVCRANIGGRIEKIVRKRTYILDGAHNPSAFAPLGEYLKSVRGSKTLIFTCLSDKDILGNLKTLNTEFDEAFAVSAPSPRAMDLNKMVSALETRYGTVSAKESVSAALSAAGGETVVVCGSFTILKEAKQWIETEL